MEQDRGFGVSTWRENVVAWMFLYSNLDPKLFAHKFDTVQICYLMI